MPFAYGHGGLHARLRLDDPARRDELHRARDLLRRLHRPDAAPEDALLTTSHRLLGSQRFVGLFGTDGGRVAREHVGGGRLRSRRGCGEEPVGEVLDGGRERVTVGERTLVAGSSS